MLLFIIVCCCMKYAVDTCNFQFVGFFHFFRRINKARHLARLGAWSRYAPVYTIGAGYHANSIINMAALNLRHAVRTLFLDFDDVTELRWPVCCVHENDNFNLLHFALFANSRRHSAYQLSPQCVIILACL